MVIWKALLDKVEPVPVRVTVAGLPAASVAIDTAALVLAVVVGVKVTEMLQWALTASVMPQVVVLA